MPDSSAPTLPAKGSRNLMLRIAAAALLAPVALMFVFAGGWLWVLLVTAIAVGLFYEWHEIVNPGRNPRTFAAGVIALELIGLALWFGWGGVAWAAIFFGVTLFVGWASDIGGYFAGRAIGGPKLWPRVSPNKTWAGSGGALVLSALVALIVSWLGWGRLVPLLILALAMSVVTQLGDLFAY